MFLGSPPYLMSWTLLKLKDIATQIYPGNELTARQMIEPGNYPCVRNIDLNKLNIKFTKCISKVDPKILKQHARLISHGCVVMSDMGTAKGLGRACAFMGKDNPIIGNSVIAIVHKENPVFLAHVLNSKFVKDQVRRQMKGTIVQHLRTKDLQNLEIPVPDRETQDKIVEMIDDMDDTVKEWGDVFKSYEELYKFTLSKILSPTE